MTIQELEQAILEIIQTIYECKYVGMLQVERIADGLKVSLGWKYDDYPISIMAQLPDDKFLDYFKEELRNRHLDHVQYFSGFKIYPGEMSCCQIDDTCKICQKNK